MVKYMTYFTHCLTNTVKSSERTIMEKIGYKVVRVVDGELHSYIIIRQPSVTYEVGKTKRPRKGCGPLCIFRDAHTAKVFADAIEDTRWPTGYRVYKCSYKKSRATQVYIPSHVVRDMDLLPKGTILASEVTLIEEVK